MSGWHQLDSLVSGQEHGSTSSSRISVDFTATFSFHVCAAKDSVDLSANDSVVSLNATDATDRSLAVQRWRAVLRTCTLALLLSLRCYFST